MSKYPKGLYEFSQEIAYHDGTTLSLGWCDVQVASKWLGDLLIHNEENDLGVPYEIILRTHEDESTVREEKILIRRLQHADEARPSDQG